MYDQIIDRKALLQNSRRFSFLFILLYLSLHFLVFFSLTFSLNSCFLSPLYFALFLSAIKFNLYNFYYLSISRVIKNHTLFEISRILLLTKSINVTLLFKNVVFYIQCQSVRNCGQKVYTSILNMLILDIFTYIFYMK